MELRELNSGQALDVHEGQSPLDLDAAESDRLVPPPGSEPSVVQLANLVLAGATLTPAASALSPLSPMADLTPSSQTAQVGNETNAALISATS